MCLWDGLGYLMARRSSAHMGFIYLEVVMYHMG